MKTILLVCTGNTCRSSMAEALLRDLLAKADLADKAVVKSAGTHTISGQPANPTARRVLAAEWQLDLSEHSTTQITPDLLASVDLILTMSNRHKEYIQANNPDLVAKVYTLPEFAGYPDEEVADPFGSGEAEYLSVAKQIYRYLEASLPKIRDFLHSEEEQE
ncbi:MAG: low molecular weight protein arginine phosphatase [Firmicutes bacterium]|nr:low molecular weight protein arginine phosphatase [Bacillota bacterium]